MIFKTFYKGTLAIAGNTAEINATCLENLNYGSEPSTPPPTIFPTPPTTAPIPIFPQTTTPPSVPLSSTTPTQTPSSSPTPPPSPTSTPNLPQPKTVLTYPPILGFGSPPQSLEIVQNELNYYYALLEVEPDIDRALTIIKSIEDLLNIKQQLIQKLL